MLKFAPQPGVEIYAGMTGLICLKQESPEFGKEVVVTLTIGQLRGLIKNAEKLIAEAELIKKELKND